MPVDNNFLDEKVRFWNKIYRGALLGFVILIFIIATIGVRQVFVVGKKIDNNIQLVQYIIVGNQQSNIAARKASIERDAENKRYIQCIALLTKKYPNVNFQALSYDESKAYLVECARVQ